LTLTVAFQIRAGRNDITWGSVYMTPLNLLINIRWFSWLF